MIGKSRIGGNAGGLSGYMNQEKKKEWREVRNLPGQDRHQDLRIFNDTASLSNRCENPVYHLSISYSPKDDPSKANMLEDIDRTLDDLGLADHQAEIVAHGDEDYKHVHIMVNRIHQDKDRAWSPWNDRDKYRPIFREIEQERGYEIVSERHWGKGKNMTNDEIHQLEERGFGGMPLKAKAAHYDWDQAFGEAENWKEIDDFLANYNCHVRPKRGGGVIEHNETGEQLKLSRVGREFSFNSLEKEHGKYEAYTRRKAKWNKMNRHFNRLPSPGIKDQFNKLIRAVKKPQDQREPDATEDLKNALNKSIHTIRRAEKVVKTFSKLSKFSGPAGQAARIGKTLAERVHKSLTQDRGRGRGLGL